MPRLPGGPNRNQEGRARHRMFRGPRLHTSVFTLRRPGPSLPVPRSLNPPQQLSSLLRPRPSSPSSSPKRAQAPPPEPPLGQGLVRQDPLGLARIRHRPGPAPLTELRGSPPPPAPLLGALAPDAADAAAAPGLRLHSRPPPALPQAHSTPLGPKTCRLIGLSTP